MARHERKHVEELSVEGKILNIIQQTQNTAVLTALNWSRIEDWWWALVKRIMCSRSTIGEKFLKHLSNCYIIYQGVN